MADIRTVKCGLFLYDCEDYHAVLGLPVDAPQAAIRERYLQVTRQLHPDRRKLQRPEDGPIADKLLAKLVNPAYETLFKNKERRTEHKFILDATAKRLAAEGNPPPLKNATAQKLAQAGRDLEVRYRSTLKELSDRLYEDVNQTTTLIGELSELNLIYIFRQALEGRSATGKTSTTATGADAAQPTATSRETAPNSGATTSATARVPTSESSPSAATPPREAVPSEQERLGAMVAPYLQRARASIQSKSYAQAVLELRDALALDPKSATSHGLLGYAYLRQNQIGMARVHTRKALQLDAKEQSALATQKELEKKEGGKNKKKSSGGFLGGLFGRGGKK
ncbi:MAG: DnaJ domain-containing protein [Cyanobacteria bacterium J06641_5]